MSPAICTPIVISVAMKFNWIGRGRGIPPALTHKSVRHLQKSEGSLEKSLKNSRLWKRVHVFRVNPFYEFRLSAATWLITWKDRCITQNSSNRSMFVPDWIYCSLRATSRAWFISVVAAIFKNLTFQSIARLMVGSWCHDARSLSSWSTDSVIYRLFALPIVSQ